MKKLSKIKLHNIVEMTDNEMKKVVGGFGATEEPTSDGSGDSCSVGGDKTCSGSCPDVPVWDPIRKETVMVPSSCVSLENSCVCA